MLRFTVRLINCSIKAEPVVKKLSCSYYVYKHQNVTRRIDGVDKRYTGNNTIVFSIDSSHSRIPYVLHLLLKYCQCIVFFNHADYTIKRVYRGYT